MLRILAFFLVVLALALGFGWLADNPGSVTFVWQGQRVETSMMVFVLALLALLAIVVILVALIRAFFRTPHAISNWWDSRRRDRGYKALSNGIIAAGAGDAVLARRMTKRSEKLIGRRKEPLIRFLDAQTAMIEGDHARARAAFEQMERDPETRLLAMRGLFLEAERVGDETAARHYAESAVRIAPHVPWAGGAVLESKCLSGDWDGALSILEAQKNSRLIDSAESKRRRAVLLTAKAMTIEGSDPSGAKKAGSEAHKLAPDLTPAAVVAADACFRLGDFRRGSKILEASWINQPHPDVAESYVHASTGRGADDRLKRAQKLADMRPGHVESEMVVARAAFAAGDLGLARQAATAAVKKEPRESGYLLLADIEEADTGQVGRIREWLARAIRAPRDPAWVADGVVSRTWAPLSPVTGHLDAFEWKVPFERPEGETGLLIDSEDEEPKRSERSIGSDSSTVREDQKRQVGATTQHHEAPVKSSVANGRKLPEADATPDDATRGAAASPDGRTDRASSESGKETAASPDTATTTVGSEPTNIPRDTAASGREAESRQEAHAR